MIADRLTVATEESFVLAEGPFWDGPRERLLWVDIQQGLVLSGVLESDGTIREVDRVAFPGTVGAVAPSAAGDWVIAGGDRLLIRSVDGAVRPGPIIIDRARGRRLNDGKPDPAGRFVAGTLRTDGPSTAEELVLVNDGVVTRIDTDLTLSNGLAWSADGTVLYSVDTKARRVYRRAWRPGIGPASPRSTFVELDEGSPDGICLDAEGYLWVAVWGRGQVRRYAPDGGLDDVLDVPAAHVSSVAFAGVSLDTLVVTTATDGLDEEQLRKFPLSGRLFTARPRVRGLPQALWSGTT